VRDEQHWYSAVENHGQGPWEPEIAGEVFQSYAAMGAVGGSKAELSDGGGVAELLVGDAGRVAWEQSQWIPR
jgi:hypothetical protein